MDDPYYLYALTRAGAVPQAESVDVGPGIDPRYPVALIPYGRLAALVSRVGLDVFDIEKLQEGTAELQWLSQIAVRHHEIIAALARRAAVLPMRLGVLFESRQTLVAKLAPYEANAAEFLRRIEDRQEWAVKLYVDVGGPPAIPPPIQPARGGAGAQYLAAKSQRMERRRQLDSTIKQTATTVEDRLTGIADSWHRLRPLPQCFTTREEKMVWNGAFLLAKAGIAAFHAACETLRRDLLPAGVIVEITGPWPPYHFCPSFEPQAVP